MALIIGLVTFVVGLLVGIIANKFMGSTSQENQELTNKLDQGEKALDEYKANVAEHLESSAKLLEQMHTTCKDAMLQMAQSTKLLQEATPDDKSAMPFFSQETQDQLAQTIKLRDASAANKKDAEITEAPLDYSGNPSGLFKDETQSVTNPKGEKKELS
ncbi:YhcB family protein [Pseudocolwellia sp. HL-MZ7]|uniref:YhcB family protein n=1 Tax=Pseudocolwellia sp. HL-MZ7 TaxID=3400627 RepID=UPI003CF0FC16